MKKLTKSHTLIKNIYLVKNHGLVYVISNIPATPLPFCGMRNHGGFFLKVDWIHPHREDIKAGVRAAVKRVLRAKGVKPTDFNVFISYIMKQAEVLYADWPNAA